MPCSASTSSCRLRICVPPKITAGVLVKGKYKQVQTRKVRDRLFGLQTRLGKLRVVARAMRLSMTSRMILKKENVEPGQMRGMAVLPPLAYPTAATTRNAIAHTSSWPSKVTGGACE